MAVPRRQFLSLAAGTVALPAMPWIARAQTYPSRSVRIIVGFSPGGGTDIIARLMGQWLSGRLGQPFLIENRPGAGTNVGTEAVVRSPPDGHTLLFVTTVAAISAAFYDKLNFSFAQNISPIASISRIPFVMVANLSLPARNVPELIAYARNNPGKINMASSGNGTLQHVAGELFKMMSGANMIHVPYRGSAPAMTDLLGGQVQVAINPISDSIEYIRDGKIRALAVTSATRLQALPGIPTMAEFVPGYEVSGWNGLGAPKNTPTEIVHKLSTAINAALSDPEIKARLSDLGYATHASSPADFGKFIADETEKWAKVVRFSGVKPD